MKKLFHMVSVFFITAFSGTVMADAYIGANVGRADPDASGFDTDISYTILGGYNFNEYFGVELYYTDAGEFDYGSVVSVEIDGWGASLVGKYPVNDDLEVFAKVGVFSWDADAHLDGFGKVASDDGTDNTWGLGAGYAVTENVDIILQFMRIDVDDGDVDNYSIGLNYNF